MQMQINIPKQIILTADTADDSISSYLATF